jgi:hypothetical protein
MIRKVYLSFSLGLFVFFLSAQLNAAPRFKKVSFYVVAHQDDWQLFMGEKAFKDIKDPLTQVIIIFVTSGEAGKDSVYWKNRDRAAFNCLSFIKNKPFKDSIPGTAVKEFLGHKIKYSNYDNVRYYYMRIPDGHGRAGVGYESYGNQSMKKFKAGEIPSMTCTDSSSAYIGWQDLVSTMKSMIDEEAKGMKEVEVHFPEYDKTINVNSHSDHLATGQIVFEALKDNSTFKKLAYVDYETQFKPVNLGLDDIMIKASLYMVYDKAVFDGSSYCTICDGKGQYSQWIFRSYYREVK